MEKLAYLPLIAILSAGMPQWAYAETKAATTSPAKAAATAAAAKPAAPAPALVGYGFNPTLPEPKEKIVPTVNVAPATGWPDGKKPIPANGFSVQAFATKLDHPRWIYVLPNGDVLVAETNKPAQPKEGGGVRGFFQKMTMKTAGADVKSANRITLLRDADGDGVAEIKRTFLEGLNSPFGMALLGDKFYVANADSIVRFPYVNSPTQIKDAPEKVVDLPGANGEMNHHWTKNLIVNADGTKLYVSVGSNSNIGENGMDKEVNRAAILEVNPVTKTLTPMATGLRNPVGMAIHPASKALWTVVNERDELGDDLVPDYLTSIAGGGFYGWPYSYFGKHVDERVKPQNPEMVAKALMPDYALGAHTASLGLAFYEGDLFPAHYSQGAFIGQHGSWNREVKSGYKVIFLPFSNGGIAGSMPEDFLTGFLDDKDNAMGRPVGVAVDKEGALLVADDVGNVIWRVTPQQAK